MARNRQTACCSNPALDDSDGQTVCTHCGSVINDSQIVSEISFGETSSGAAVVNGAFVGAGETHARNTGPFRKGGGLESREQTLANGEDIFFFLSSFFLASRPAHSALLRFFHASTFSPASL